MIVNWKVGDMGDLPYASIAGSAENLNRTRSCVLECPDDGVLTTARADDQYFSHFVCADAATWVGSCQHCPVLTRIALTHFRHRYIPVPLRAALAGFNLYYLIGGKPKSVLNSGRLYSPAGIMF